MVGNAESIANGEENAKFTEAEAEMKRNEKYIRATGREPKKPENRTEMPSTKAFGGEELHRDWNDHLGQRNLETPSEALDKIRNALNEIGEDPTPQSSETIEKPKYNEPVNHLPEIINLLEKKLKELKEHSSEGSTREYTDKRDNIQSLIYLFEYMAKNDIDEETNDVGDKLQNEKDVIQWLEMNKKKGQLALKEVEAKYIKKLEAEGKSYPKDTYTMDLNDRLEILHAENGVKQYEDALDTYRQLSSTIKHGENQEN